MKVLSVVLLLLHGTLQGQVIPAATGNGQVHLPATLFLDEVYGKPLSPGGNEVKGSPFLKPWWSDAVIRLEDARVFEKVPVRINLYTQAIHYLSHDKELEAPAGIVREVTLTDTAETGQRVTRVFRNGYPSFRGASGSFYYEVIEDGAVQLLLMIQKKILATKTLGSPVEEKEFVTAQQYVVYKNGQMHELKRNKAFITTLLADQKEGVDNFVSTHHLKCKSIDDCQQLIRFYNSR